MKTANLRRECKLLMVRLGLDGRGSRARLAGAISTAQDRVNPGSLSMALTGYRGGARSRELLERLYSYLRLLKAA